MTGIMETARMVYCLGFREFARHTAGKKEIVDEVFFR